MSKKFTLVIVEDHPITRYGVNNFVNQLSKFEICGEFDGVTAALANLSELNPNFLILDINLPDGNGICIAKECLRKQLRAKIIFLTSHVTPKIVEQLSGYSNVYAILPKDSFLKDIEMALDHLTKGVKYYPTDVQMMLNQNNSIKNEILNRLDLLTKTEVKVIHLVSENLNSKEISEVLFISKETVKKHRSNISSKLGLSGNHNLIKFCIAHKYVLENYEAY